MLRAKHMGFRSVKCVEVKAETTTPGEVRTTTDATGARVSTSRGRRTLPKLEFSVDEDGAILHGPQRGALPSQGFFSSSGSGSFSAAGASAQDTAAAERDLLYQSASFQALHMRDFPSPPSRSGSQRDMSRFFDETDEGGDATAAAAKRQSVPVPPMKECVLNDTRATTMAIKYDNAVGKFVCGSSIERFSGHTGVCRVLGSKKYPIIPHNLQIGDLLRIGSVGLVVCELNRTARDETQEALSEEEYEFLKEHYLSLPLQQTFHPTESQSHMNNHNNNSNNGDEEDEDDDDSKHSRRGFRAGETSDEGESEEDRRAGGRSNSGSVDGDDLEAVHERSIGASGMVGKKFCYICYDGDEEPEENPLVAPCHCKGDTKYVHLNCLQRWNNNLDADGTNPNQKVCAVTNTDGLDVCTICKATYLTSVKLEDGRVVSLLAQKLPPPYVTFAVVTQHETRNRQTALTNTRFQLSFANMPRNQQYLTIGRSTTNNMTLRYRTVSQLHAKIKYQDDNFFLFDASSSNGTMLFLSRPLELDWNKTVHVKIGRTILTLKSKKRWKWNGGNNEQNGNEIEYGSTAGSPPPSATSAVFPATPTNQTISATSPPPHTRGTNNNQSRAPHRSVPNRFESNNGSTVLNDPSAELVSSPYSLRDLLGRSYPAPGSRRGFHEFDRALASPVAGLGNQVESMRLSDLVEEEPLLAADGSRRVATQQPILPHQRRMRAGSAGSVLLDGGDELAATHEEHRRQQQHDAALYEIAASFPDVDVANLRVVDPGTGIGSPIVVSSVVDGSRD